MSIALVHAEGGTLLVRASGDITYPEVERILDEIARALQVHGAVNLLADCRGIRSTISAAELRKTAAELKPFINQGIRHFALVTDSTFMYGIGRMFGALVELTGAHLSVFADVESAQRWLDENQPRPRL
jgi:hypothetical protein